MSDVYVEIEDSSANKKPRRVYEAKERKCLMCSETFRSEGAHNRICPKCKLTRTWRSGGVDVRCRARKDSLQCSLAPAAWPTPAARANPMTRARTGPRS